MAIFCLATDLADLKARIGRIVVGYTRDKTPIRASDLKAEGALTAVLKDALAPNLVQTPRRHARIRSRWPVCQYCPRL